MLNYFLKVLLTNFFDCGVDRAVVPDDGPVEVGDGGDLLDAEVVWIQHTECFHRKANQGLPLKIISVFTNKSDKSSRFRIRIRVGHYGD